jgi:glycosyltransferase involved in cell wall biosynthesis
LVTNQALPNNIKKTIDDLVEEYSTTNHESFKNTNGLGGVLQAGLESCSESYVARMDADDISHSDRFAKQFAVLSESDVDIVGSHLIEFENNPEHVKRIRKVPITHDKIAEWMAWRCPLNHPTTMFNRKTVLNVGGYREFPMMEDWDLWARCLANNLQFKNLDQVLVRAQIGELASRRQGLDYIQAEIRMLQELRRLGISSPIDTARHLFFRTPVRVMPAQLQKLVYRVFARKST